MKHYKLVEFLSNLNVNPPLHERKAPPHKRKAPYWRLSGDGSDLTSFPVAIDQKLSCDIEMIFYTK